MNGWTHCGLSKQWSVCYSAINRNEVPTHVQHDEPENMLRSWTKTSFVAWFHSYEMSKTGRSMRPKVVCGFQGVGEEGVSSSCYEYEVSLRRWKCSGIGQWWWLYISLWILKTNKLYILKNWIFYVMWNFGDEPEPKWHETKKWLHDKLVGLADGAVATHS